MISIWALATLGQAATLTPRIIGGNRIALADAPPTVALLGTDGVGLYVGCGGTLLGRPGQAPDWVVTAAHCLDNVRAADLSVAHSADLRLLLRFGLGKRYAVSKIIQHPQWRGAVFTGGSQLANDIALLQLSEGVTSATPAVVARCTPEAGRRASVFGWGSLNAQTGEGSSSFLRRADVEVLKSQDCFGGLAPKQVCAGFLLGGIDSCLGDSGGPLALEQGGHWQLLALVSGGTANPNENVCAAPFSPGVYEQISEHLDWIQTQTSGAVIEGADVDCAQAPHYDLNQDWIPDHLNADNTDSDADGVPDIIEQLQRTNSNNPLSFNDYDSDGVPDYTELLNGSNAREQNHLSSDSNEASSRSGGGAMTPSYLFLLLVTSVWSWRLKLKKLIRRKVFKVV